MLLGCSPAWAGPPATTEAPASSGTNQNSPQNRLSGIETQLKGSKQARQRLEANLEMIRADRARLEAALLAAASKTQADEQRVAALEAQLETAKGSQDAIRGSLLKHRKVIEEVLAALQRMGRKPPPAVLVDPQDMLRAIRTSMLLGSILPNMRVKIRALVSDLKDLARVRTAISKEKTSLSDQLAKLTTERVSLNGLIERRQRAQEKAQQDLAVETKRSRALARQASSLEDLISKMETQVGPAEHGALAGGAGKGPKGEVLAALPPQNPARLAPAVPFAQTRGLLPTPVVGSTLKAYGEPDGFGGREKGVSIATRSGAVVVSPADAWVAYAGPYRSYGQLLILNAGGGYYLVLAGMDKIDVEIGQFVLAGEPVGAMGDGSLKTAADIAIGAAQPVLYVEFRKNGKTIDPGPWWAKPELEKARG